MAALVIGIFAVPRPTPAQAQSCQLVQPPVGDPFPDCSGQQVLNILPPGNNGLTTIFDETQHAQEAHATDQQGMYAGLKSVAPNLQTSQLGSYYKQAGFAVPSTDIDHTTTFAPPHDGTVIVWDRSFGVPHVYGRTRADTEFGAGYAAAHDRLFVMDVLRHIGRSRLSQFIGPSPSAFQEDCALAQVAGYSEQELTYQANLLPARYTTPLGTTTEGQQVFEDGTNYVAGVNTYIDAAALDPNLMPVEYAALPPGQTVPHHWTPADIVAVAAIVQSIFAVGGGDEVDSWFLYRALADKFGAAKGFQIWHDLRRQNDAGAPTTLSEPFPYLNDSNSDSTTLPGIADLESRVSDGSHYVCASHSVSPSAAVPDGPPRISLDLPPLIPGHEPMSNALLIGAGHSAGGHPIAVFGPQVGYFIPELLHEEDLHGPGLHARGASFPGTDIYVELGHGTSYAWSATSASSDLIDQRLELICDPASPSSYVPGPADGQFYWYNHACDHRMYERVDTEAAATSGAAPYPPQLITFHIERTIHGPVVGRGSAQLSGFGAVPVAIAVQRSTWFDELGAAPAFLEYNDPDIVHNSSTFLSAAARETGTFNWFYADSSDIAYYSSGRLPIRSRQVNPNFISWGTSQTFEWQGFQVGTCAPTIATPPGPDSTGATTTGASTTACGYSAHWLRADGSAHDPHPHTINPPSGFMANWNNKPAPQWSAADNNFGFGSVYRVMSLNDRIEAALARGPATPVDIVNGMEDAGSVDLDGSKLVPPMLTVLDGGSLSAEETQVVTILSNWVQSNDLGAHRREMATDPSRYDQGNAVAIMDALYPNLVYAIFDPWLGQHDAPGNLYGHVFALKRLANAPGPLGSAYDESAGGWESYVNTALRQIAAESIPDAYSQLYCGSSTGSQGTLAGCRLAIVQALDATIARLTAAYGTSDPTLWTCSTNNTLPGECNPSNDYIHFQAVGAQSTTAIPWINRPTFQQVVQYPLP